MKIILVTDKVRTDIEKAEYIKEVLKENKELENLEVLDFSVEGDSTTKFIDDYKLAPVYDAVSKDDICIYGFGKYDILNVHNSEESPKKLINDFKVNLWKMNNVCNNKGAKAFFAVTSCDNNEYNEKFINVAKEMGVEENVTVQIR